MAKYNIDIIINDRTIEMAGLIDLEKYKLQSQIGYFDDHEVQITSGINAKRFDGYANVSMTNVEYL